MAVMDVIGLTSLANSRWAYCQITVHDIQCPAPTEAQTLHECLNDFGLPEIVYTDHGCNFSVGLVLWVFQALCQ